MPHEQFLVTHHGRLHDIGPFLARHPGGLAHLEPYRGRSVTALLKSGHGDGEAASALVHSDAARYILQHYRLNGDTKQPNGVDATKLNGHKNGISNGHVAASEDDIEDMENLVDWSKPMLTQVASLGSQYERWVNFPVERKLRLFGPDIIEELTKARWYFVPLFWVPVTIGFLAMHAQGGHWWSMAIVGVILGVFNWTLLEYSLHRWVFHLQPGSSPVLITFHFLIHGLHHKVPFDSMRLVFPPVPAAILGFIFYNAYNLVLPDCLINSVAAGTAIGYIIYDLTHYYLHFGAPQPSTYMYNMKRYHNRHHFSHHDQGYGISSAFWDNVFGTTIILQKLAKAIKW